MVRSISRVPTQSTRSASRASAFAARVPVTPIPPIASAPPGSAPLPADVSATGIAEALRRARPAPAARPSSGRRRPRSAAAARAARSASAAARSSESAGGRRVTCQVRGSKSAVGKSHASAWTSWCSESVTAPVSAGSSSTRIASGSAVDQLLGAGDPVEEGAERPEGVVHREVGLERVLERLHHRSLAAVRERVGRQQQHRHAVDGRGRRARQQVRGARGRSTPCTRASTAGCSRARSRSRRAPSPARSSAGGS